MNLCNKVLALVFLTLNMNACGQNDFETGANSTGNKTCVEKQKQALKNAGIITSNDQRDLKKLAQMDAEFFKTIPYCSE